MRLGPAWFRRKLLDLIPSTKIQRVKDNLDKVNEGCVKIFNAKKHAIQRGDEELLETLGEGKDVLSVLCERSVLQSYMYL